MTADAERPPNGNGPAQWRKDHEDRHSRERAELAQATLRLETQVAEAATRLEGQVEKTRVALSDQADVHAKNHDREHAAHERIHAVEEANRSDKSETMNKRLEGMNEIRDQLREQATTFARADAVTNMVGRIEEKIDGFAREQGVRANGLEKQLSLLEKQLAARGGVEEGSRITTGKLYAAIGGLAAFLGVVVVIVNLLTR